METKLKVLLVDDAAYVRDRLAELILEMGGVDIVGQVGSVTAGLMLIEEFHPDLLVLDLEMPEHSGLEMLRALQGKPSGMTIIVLSNYYSDVLKRHCARLGAHHCLCKVSEFEQVATICGSLLEKTRTATRGSDAAPRQ